MTDRDQRIASVFQALSDPTRRAVVRALSEHGDVTATELAGEFLVSRQAVSKHLAALAEAGLVESERRGREVRYRLTPRPMAEAMDWMAGVGADWDERLARLRRHLRR